MSARVPPVVFAEGDVRCAALDEAAGLGATEAPRTAADQGASQPEEREIDALQAALNATPAADRPAEATAVHTRLLKCALEVEAARAYWPRAAAGARVEAAVAFDQLWFGAKSLDRVSVLLSNMRARFDAFPACLPVLAGWAQMPPSTRALLCHWHLQLSDPLYRAFTDSFLCARRAGLRPTVSHDVVVAWVGDQGRPSWTAATRVQFASKLLSSAASAGLIGSTHDARPLTLPRVDDDALTYLLYLLRGVDFEGTLTDNPYLRSVGLTDLRSGGPTLAGQPLDERLRRLPALRFRRQGALVDLGWVWPDVGAWAAATVCAAPPTHPEPA